MTTGVCRDCGERRAWETDMNALDKEISQDIRSRNPRGKREGQRAAADAVAF